MKLKPQRQKNEMPEYYPFYTFYQMNSIKKRDLKIQNNNKNFIYPDYLHIKYDKKVSKTISLQIAMDSEEKLCLSYLRDFASVKSWDYLGRF